MFLKSNKLQVLIAAMSTDLISSFETCHNGLFGDDVDSVVKQFDFWSFFQQPYWYQLFQDNAFNEILQFCRASIIFL